MKSRDKNALPPPDYISPWHSSPRKEDNWLAKMNLLRECIENNKAKSQPKSMSFTKEQSYQIQSQSRIKCKTLNIREYTLVNKKLCIDPNIGNSLMRKRLNTRMHSVSNEQQSFISVLFVQKEKHSLCPSIVNLNSQSFEAKQQNIQKSKSKIQNNQRFNELKNHQKRNMNKFDGGFKRMRVTLKTFSNFQNV